MRNNKLAQTVITDKGKCDLQNKPGDWFAVDLGEVKLVTRIVLDAQSTDRYPRAWGLRISTDGKIWSEPIASGKGTGSVTPIDIEPKKIRHIKITQTGESKHHRWSVRTIQIHGR
jgi:glucosylceramidase